LLDHQNNYIGHSMSKQHCLCLNIRHNYFNSPTKFLDLYPAKFLHTLVKSFFPCILLTDYMEQIQTDNI